MPGPTAGRRDCARVVREHWGIDAVQITDLPSERDLNAMVDGQYVLKVSNPAEDRGAVDLESVALAHAARVDPDLPLPRTVPTLSGSWTATVVDADGRECLARRHHRPARRDGGGPAGHARHSPRRSVPLTARMSIALQGLFHPAADRELDWDVRRADAVLADADPAVLDLTADELDRLRSRCAAAAAASRALPSGSTTPTSR